VLEDIDFTNNNLTTLMEVSVLNSVNLKETTLDLRSECCVVKRHYDGDIAKYLPSFFEKPNIFNI